jgi:hypothetical protein
VPSTSALWGGKDVSPRRAEERRGSPYRRLGRTAAQRVVVRTICGSLSPLAFPPGGTERNSFGLTRTSR